MSSISSIGSGMSISGAYITPSNQLSEATKAKLEALGIDPASVTSEAEAQSLIAQVESMSKTDKARPQSGSSDMALLTKAKELAEDVGAKISERDNLDDICKKISEKIEQLVQQYASDPVAMNKLEDYQRELSSIDSRYSSKIDTQDSIFAAMNMISASNKYALGLQ